MGTTFVNLQIHNICPADVQKHFNLSSVNELSKNWITVTDDEFDIGSIEKAAKALSRLINKSVLSVSYFDDDILILQIFKLGKLVTKYVSDSVHGCKKTIGNINSFIKELELDNQDTERLKWIFSSENLEKKIVLLEKLLGTALWSDQRMIDENGTDAFEIERDVNFVDEYIKEYKKANQVKNQLNAKLRNEISGIVEEQLESNRFLIRFLDENNEMYFCKPKNELSIYKEFNANLLKIKHDDEFIANYSFVAKFKAEKTMFLYDFNGNLIYNTIKIKKDHFPLRILENGNILFLKYGSENVISEQHKNNNEVWTFYTPYLHVNPIFNNDGYYFHYEDFKNKISEIVKLNIRGDVVNRFPVNKTGSCHWDKFLFDKSGNFYYGMSTGVGENEESKLYYFDQNVNLIWDIDVGDTSFDGILDEKNMIIFMTIFEKELLGIDIANKQIKSKIKYEDCFEILCVDKKGKLYLRNGLSTVMIFDSDLNLISKHKLKGYIFCNYVNESENVCFWTHTEYEQKSKNKIRVYEFMTRL